MKNAFNNAFYVLTVFSLLTVTLLSGCQQEFQNRPTLSPTYSPTTANTATLTPTSTIVPTVTPTPSKTFTPTLTPHPTLTSTPTSTPVPSNPAELFEFYAWGDRLVDWSFHYISEEGIGMDEKVNFMTVMFAFQLLDRGIHTENIKFLDKDITMYYLNVQHEFDDVLIPMRLIIGGTYGIDVPLQQILADGSSYVTILEKKSNEIFEPNNIHQDAQLPYEERQIIFTDMLLQDFEQYLTELPNQVILFSEHPILFPQDDWPKFKLDMSRVSSIAARYLPFFELDVYERIIAQSENANDLASYLLANKALPKNEYVFSAKELIFVTP